jgi:hypothetical protein
MKFVDKLLSFLGSGLRLVGDMLYKLIQFLAKPLSYLYYFLDGIFYFIFQVGLVIYKIISIFVALFQFFFAIVAGFLRFIGSMLWIDPTKTPIHYPSTSGRGLQVVVELLQPTGLMTVLPLICIALLWFFFVKKVIGLIGGEVRSDA